MYKLLKTSLLVVILTLSSTSVLAAATPTTGSQTAATTAIHNERNYFQFEIPKYETKRQGGQTVSVYVRFVYKKGLPEAQYVDYRVMRQEILNYMEPTEKYPVNVYWEILATRMGRDLMQHYPIEGVSVQLVVLDNQKPDAFEPGDHGPIFTAGNIEAFTNK